MFRQLHTHVQNTQTCTKHTHMYKTHTCTKHTLTLLKALCELVARSVLDVLNRITKAHATSPAKLLPAHSASHVIATLVDVNDSAARRAHLLVRQHRNKLLTLLTYVLAESFVVPLQAAQTERMAVRANRTDTMKISRIYRTLVEQKAFFVFASRMWAVDGNLILPTVGITDLEEINNPAFAKP